MSDVIEVSYTGDLLAHRRCRRAWAYEKRAGFHPYEVVQAMEGRLVHHAMEWLTRQHQEAFGRRRHVTEAELRSQMEHYFRVLWARGIRTAFASKQETIDRVVGNLYPGGRIDPVVKAVIEGAQHTEYELRAVKKVLPADAASFSGNPASCSPASWTWSSSSRVPSATSARGCGTLLPTSAATSRRPRPRLRSATSRSGTTRAHGQTARASTTTSANSSPTLRCTATAPGPCPSAACSSSSTSRLAGTVDS